MKKIKAKKIVELEKGFYLGIESVQENTFANYISEFKNECMYYSSAINSVIFTIDDLWNIYEKIYDEQDQCLFMDVMTELQDYSKTNDVEYFIFEFSNF